MELGCNQMHDANFIKSRLIDFLLRTDGKKIRLIASEVPFAGSRRKADIICITDRLSAYEIKTQRDNYSKLINQARDYAVSFEYSYLVSDKATPSWLIRRLPNQFGILTWEGNMFKINSRAQLRKRLSKYHLASFLWTDEIMTLLRNNNISASKIDDAHSLRMRLTNRLTISAIREAAINTLLTRYHSRYCKFLAERGHTTHSEDLVVLNSPERHILANCELNDPQ